MIGQIGKLFLILFCIHFCNLTKGKEIQTAQILPENSEPIVLDCKYDSEGYNSTLVVKWFKDEKPVYHWIKGHKPFVYEPFKKLIDDEFEISDLPNEKHRAIKFPTPAKNLSGTYKCLVTMKTTQSNLIYLQVVDVSETNFELSYEALFNETHITCEVENVYPEPKLLIWAVENKTINIISEKVVEEDDLFNATSIASIADIEGADEIFCTFTFPGIDYNMTRSIKSSAEIKRIETVILFVMLFMLALSLK